MSELIPFSVDDLYLHRRPSRPHCVDRADKLVCSVRSVDRERDSYSHRLLCFALDGSGGRALSQEAGDDTSPRWSPLGDRIAFLSTRGGNGTQVYIVRPDGLGLRQLSDFTLSAGNFRWLPHGTALLVSAAVSVDPDLRGQRAPAHHVAKPAPAELAWRLPYKEDGIGYLLRREIRLFRIDAASGQQQRLTDGPFDVFGFDISASGDRIAYTRSRDGRFAHCFDLWSCGIDGSNPRHALFWCAGTASGTPAE